jgi:hypothetical protein
MTQSSARQRARMWHLTHLLVAAPLLASLGACSSGPRTPDWALQAQASLERATQADLSGEQRLAAADYERARQQLARTGRGDAVARAELLRCAARFASLQFLPQPLPGAAAADGTAPADATLCPAFDTWRSAAGPADLAYADFLAGRLEAARIHLLPPAQQAAATAGQDAARRTAAIRAIEDPLSRLVAAAAALRDGVAPPGMAELAIETASGQGWRRPLLAWLGFQMRRSLAAGDDVGARALQQRIDLVLSSQASVSRQAPSQGPHQQPQNR